MTLKVSYLLPVFVALLDRHQLKIVAVVREVLRPPSFDVLFSFKEARAQVFVSLHDDESIVIFQRFDHIPLAVRDVTNVARWSSSLGDC